MGILNNFNEELHNKTLREEGYEEGFSNGYVDGLEKGLSKGIDDELERIVLANLEKGRSVEEIADFTGESVSRIKEIEARMAVI